nr:uncharacterized protein LOC121470046 [Taeniopygia guttata]
MVLDDVKRMARRAFLQIQPAGTSEKAYNLVTQGSSEPFTTFVDRVIQATERQCGDDLAQPIMIWDILKNNANAQCKRIIKALGKERPTVPEMIEACNCVGSPYDVAVVQANEPKETQGDKLERALAAQAQQAEARDQRLTEFLAALHLSSQQQYNTMASCKICEYPNPNALRCITSTIPANDPSLLPPGTWGTLATSKPTTFLKDDGYDYISTGITGPSQLRQDFLIVGKERNCILGLLVLPCVVSANCNEELLVLAKAYYPPLHIPPRTPIATAIARPMGTMDQIPPRCFPVTSENPEVLWVQHISELRPMLTCELSNGGVRVTIKGMIDTGADISVISSCYWQTDWRLVPPPGTLTGIGGDTKALSTLKLTWKTDTPVWVDQWPLPDNKLSALKELVAEQLQKGHSKPTNSPWNSPVFVIHKKASNTWRLLHDLRKINEVIENMGPLQPGLPNLSMIPRDWPLIIIDLKDCFFNIPLHPDDAPRFAFSVPSTNLQEPLQRYHWLSLPQGMKNSPTICQYFVARALTPVRQKFPQSVILHYMDDLLIAAPTQEQMRETCSYVVAEVKKAELVISESKIQETAPWKYLGWKLTDQSIYPQKIQIRTDVRTLQDLQQILGEINWVRPVLGITADELAPLFDLLKGDNELRSPRSLTPEACKALEHITDVLQNRQAHHYVPGQPFFLAILGEKLRLCGLIFQWDSSLRDLLLVIEWVFISYRSPKTILTPLEMMSQIIIKGRASLLSIAGREFETIYLPMKKTYFDWAMQKSEDLL